LEIPDGTWVASARAITAKRPVLVDFLGRLAQAEFWALQHPEDYAQLYSRQTGLAIDVTRVIVRHTRYRNVPIDDAIVHEHQAVADLYFHAGVIPRSFDVAAAFDRTVYAASVESRR
jgi:sulfonate transport system substrate-binding protein